MDEKRILKQIGLSDSKLKEYLGKLNRFYGELTAAEKRVFVASMGRKEDAMRSFKPELEADELEDFLESRQEKAPTVFILWGLGHRRRPRPRKKYRK